MNAKDLSILSRYATFPPGDAVRVAAGDIKRILEERAALLAAVDALCPDDPPSDMPATESTWIVCLVGEIRRARAAIALAERP